MRLDFGNLPLVEAAVRASFAEPLPLRFSTIYEAHQRLKDKFPHLSEPERHEVAPGVSETLELKPGSLTGVILTHNRKGLSATVQNRLAVVRWVKSFPKDAPEYPGFAELRDSLWEVVSVFQEVSGISSLPVAVVNMSYVNFIDVKDPATVLKRYFSDLVQIKATENAERIHQVELSWREDGVDLRFRLQHVEAKVGDQVKDGFQLTTIAGMDVSGQQDDPKQKLEAVHDRLQELFFSLLSDHAREEWQLTEVPHG